MPAAGGSAALTEAERFKQLFVSDRFDEAGSLCERRVAECDHKVTDLEAQAKQIVEDAATWRKRLNAVRAMQQ